MQFLTASGVFSLKKIDKGSLLLLEKAEIKNTTKDILDLGCGYGPIGIAIAKSFPKKQILMSDVNERAVKLAKKNIKINNVENAKAIISDGFDKIKASFDLILLNPPQTAGRKLCYKLIEQSKQHLNQKGTLQIVARHQKGGKQFELFLKDLFGNCKTLAKKSGYRIYCSELI